MSVEEKKTPTFVHCGSCGYEWIVMFLPADMRVVAQMMKAARCPYCCEKKNIQLGPLPKPTGDGDAEGWIRNGDTGTSSETIWSVLSGHPVRKTDIPYDPDDFGRCYRLLRVMPSWRARLGEVADVHSAWRPLVDAWDELTALYEEELPSGRCPKLYQRLQVLRGRA